MALLNYFSLFQAGNVAVSMQKFEKKLEYISNRRVKIAVETPFKVFVTI